MDRKGERGPDPDDPYDLPYRIKTTIRDIIAEEVGRIPVGVRIGNYEGANRDALLKWLLGIASSLLVMAIVGEVVQYGQQQAILSRLDYMQQQIIDIKKQNATVYRGAS